MELADPDPGPVRPMYALTDSVPDKINAVARRIYGADGVDFTREAEKGIERALRLGCGELPICMAKTQNSLSDDPTLRGRPSGFRITVRDVVVNSGAGFLVVLTGEMMRMPGLPKVPQGERVDLVDGQIVGVG